MAKTVINHPQDVLLASPRQANFEQMFDHHFDAVYAYAMYRVMPDSDAACRQNVSEEIMTTP